MMNKIIILLFCCCILCSCDYEYPTIETSTNKSVTASGVIYPVYENKILVATIYADSGTIYNNSYFIFHNVKIYYADNSVVTSEQCSLKKGSNKITFGKNVKIIPSHGTE